MAFGSMTSTPKLNKKAYHNTQKTPQAHSPFLQVLQPSLDFPFDFLVFIPPTDFSGLTGLSTFFVLILAPLSFLILSLLLFLLPMDNRKRQLTNLPLDFLSM